MLDYIIFFSIVFLTIAYQYKLLLESKKDLKTAEQRKLMHFLSCSNNLKEF